METASTHVLLVDSVGTADQLQFRALETVCTFSLCLMATKISMDSLPLSRKAQVCNATRKTKIQKTKIYYYYYYYYYYYCSRPLFPTQ